MKDVANNPIIFFTIEDERNYLCENEFSDAVTSGNLEKVEL